MITRRRRLKLLQGHAGPGSLSGLTGIREPQLLLIPCLRRVEVVGYWTLKGAIIRQLSKDNEIATHASQKKADVALAARQELAGLTSHYTATRIPTFGSSCELFRYPLSCQETTVYPMVRRRVCISSVIKVGGLSATKFGDRMTLGTWSCSEIGEKLHSSTSRRGEARS